MRWKYKTVRITRKKFISSLIDMKYVEERLNTYGAQGWELVSAETVVSFLGVPLVMQLVMKMKDE